MDDRAMRDCLADLVRKFRKEEFDELLADEEPEGEEPEGDEPKLEVEVIEVEDEEELDEVLKKLMRK